ncbi:tRNA lysidine(34) synthetase TilS [Dactylosporangium salmoneum]|uniref:tRNA(Ile)-lysidine synthase n=1 Tax=Dactylosporangium salmoneum TaxID=53361 RepID=A0ABP5UIV2_9ACTN
MAALAPAVAAVRNAVRRSLSDVRPAGSTGQPAESAGLAHGPGPTGERRAGERGAGVVAGETVLVACSGGADSLALAMAARFVARRLGLRCGLVTVDHGLQAGSDERAARLAEWARGQGFDPVDVRTVRVGTSGGPEAAAREARYEALEAAAIEHGTVAVLLGHTRDDQAETVLLALARGAGPRGVAGMRERLVRRGILFLRPLLDVGRAETRAACLADGLPVWEDPHNTDPAYARSRVRPLVEALGAGVVDNLARTARLIGADSAYLDELAAEALEKALEHVEPSGAGGVPAGGAGEGALVVGELARLADPVRTRVLHAWALRLGAPGGALSHRHVAALDALVVNWHGQGAVALPGGVSVARAGRVLLARR